MTEENTTKTDIMRGKLECFSIIKQKKSAFLSVVYGRWQEVFFHKDRD